MKGLLLKDFYNLRGIAKQYIFSMVFLFIWSAVTKNESLFPMMILMLSSMSILTTLTYDESAHFDKYALTLPITKEELVKSKYLLLFLLIGAGLGIGLAGAFLMRGFLHTGTAVLELLLSVLIVGGMFLMIFSILLPVVFKLGVEKARMIMMGIYLVMFLGVFGVIKLVSGVKGEMGPLSDSAFFILCGIGAAVVACIVIVTYFISLRIIRKREW